MSNLRTGIEGPQSTDQVVLASSASNSLHVADHADTGSLREGLAALIRLRRRVRMLRFIVCEAVAIGIMVGSALAGLSARFAAESFTPIFRVVPIGAAIVATILPILFFGNPMRRKGARR